ncbi:MAG TPA: hypothetical protein DCR93_09430, partial [Cytophagales bacterium]|nr:hypothetical protein [Cytophagales bacterium]
LGVPWQTDEASCLSGGEYDPSIYLPLPSFWAARVPNQVMSEDSFRFLKQTGKKEINIGQRLKFLDRRQDWLRDFSNTYQARINDMVHDWYQLGIIAPKEVNWDNEMLPDNMWFEHGRYFTQADQTVRQQRYANNLQSEPKEESPEDVKLNFPDVSLAAAEPEEVNIKGSAAYKGVAEDDLKEKKPKAAEETKTVLPGRPRRRFS